MSMNFHCFIRDNFVGIASRIALRAWTNILGSHPNEEVENFIAGRAGVQHGI